MASYYKKLSATIAKDASCSAAIDLQDWAHVAIEVPTVSAMDKAVIDFSILGCSVATGPFRYTMAQADSSSISRLNVPSQAGNYIVPLEFGSLLPQFIKVQADTTATATAGLLCNVLVSN